MENRVMTPEEIIEGIDKIEALETDMKASEMNIDDNVKEITELKASIQNIKHGIVNNAENINEERQRDATRQEVLQELMNTVKRMCHSNKRLGELFQEGEWDAIWESFKLEISKLEEKLDGEKTEHREGSPKSLLMATVKASTSQTSKMTDSKPSCKNCTNECCDTCIDFSNYTPIAKAQREDSKHSWSHLTDVSYCDICNQFAHHVGYESECNIAKAEELVECKHEYILYANNFQLLRLVCKHCQDVREISEESRQILKNIIEKEAQAKAKTCPICNGTGINVHIERDDIGLKKEVEKPCQCKKEANIEQIIEIYDNGHKDIFYPDTHILVEREELRELISGYKYMFFRKRMKEKYLSDSKEEEK